MEIGIVILRVKRVRVLYPLLMDFCICTIRFMRVSNMTFFVNVPTEPVGRRIVLVNVRIALCQLTLL